LHLPAEIFCSEARKLDEYGRKFCLQSISFIPIGFFNIPYNFTTLDQRLYFPFEGSRVMDFYCHW
jgi:hypothetical protein